jgi:hypothetical protein
MVSGCTQRTQRRRAAAASRLRSTSSTNHAGGVAPPRGGLRRDRPGVERLDVEPAVHAVVLGDARGAGEREGLHAGGLQVDEHARAGGELQDLAGPPGAVQRTVEDVALRREHEQPGRRLGAVVDGAVVGCERELLELGREHRDVGDAADLGERPPHAPDERALGARALAHQPEQDLGVDLVGARELGVLAPQRRVVDDDAVVDAGDIVDADRLVVGVLGLRAVGDQPRVADHRDAIALHDRAQVAGVRPRAQQLGRRHRRLEHADLVAGDARDPRCLLAARLGEPEQRAQQVLGAVGAAGRDHAEDAAHVSLAPRAPAPRPARRVAAGRSSAG